MRQFCRKFPATLRAAAAAVAAGALLAAALQGCGGRRAADPKLKPEHKERLKHLVKILRSQPLPEGGFQAVLAACDDEHPLVRARAAEGLGDLKIEAAASVTKLAAMLGDESDEVRAAAAFALQGFGAAASGAAESLVALLDEKEKTATRMAAALAVASALDPESADPTLLSRAKGKLAAILDSGEDDLKNNAILALGDLKAVEVLGRLVGMLSSEENYFLREACAMAVGKMGKSDAAAVEALASIVRAPAQSNEERSLKVVSARALWAADPGNRLSVPVLVEALAGEESSQAKMAREGLAQIGEHAVLSLAALLSNEREEVRALAAATLGDMGKAAFSAIPDLQRVSSGDESDLARYKAREALLKIEEAGQSGRSGSPPGEQK